VGEREVCGAGQRDGVVPAKDRGCRSGSLRLSSPAGLGASCPLTTPAQRHCKQVTGVTCHLS